MHLLPVEVYGKETTYLCGKCGREVEVAEGAVMRLPAGLRPPRAPLAPSPLERFMTTRSLSEKAEDLLARRQELLDAAAEDDEW
jgi:hypothetical protein